MLLLRGYIDESYDHSKVPKVFTLSCLISFDNMWPWFEMAWVKVLEETNAWLKQQGRPTISRFHATDWNGSFGEFAGWAPSERLELAKKLVVVFRNHGVHLHSFDLPLQTMVQEIPETASNPIGFAYVLLFVMLADQISKGTLPLYPHDYIVLHHDHCDYDGALADTFAWLKKDKAIHNISRFVSLTPEYGEHCVLLQPADLIAFENFKEGMRFHYPDENKRPIRGSLQAIFDLDAVSGRSSAFGPTAIEELKRLVREIDPKIKGRIFSAARIKP